MQPVAVPRSQTAGAANNLGLLTTDTLTNNYGVSQNMKWGGGLRGWVQQQPSGAVGPVRHAEPGSECQALTGVYVQPLLRNFRIDGTRATLQITKINQEISETALRATISRTLVTVRNAYWDLVYAIAAAEVAERSLSLATRLVEDNQARVEVGTLAPLDVLQAQAEQANRRGTVAQTAPRGAAGSP